MTFICLGNYPVPGCGKRLTEEEKEFYGTCCTDCIRLWDEMIDEWKKGAENPELDAMFSGEPLTIH